MNVTIIGLDHATQWQDKTGRLKELLIGLFESVKPDLVAEESSDLMPTTVGQRLASKLDLPWINIDMNAHERVTTGLDFDAPTDPLFDDSFECVGMSQSYIPEVQDVRESYWLNQLAKCRCERVIVVCGAIHLEPFANKMEQHGHSVTRISAWEFDWYKSSAGDLRILEEDGRRRSEFRLLR